MSRRNKYSRRSLGMDRPISRRDLLHGFGAAAAAAFVPGRAFADQALAAELAQCGHYPPAMTGLRGSHPGSFEVAHQLAQQGKRDWGKAEQPDAACYDLVVVGAGISGLSAAYFYQKEHPDARILILDNHDDFGGHAKRNEFDIDGRTLIGYGGSQTMEDPSDYRAITKKMLADLEIDLSRFDTAYDYEFYRRHGLAGGVFFDRENWGSDRLVRYDLGRLESYLPLAAPDLTAAEAVAEMPMSEAAQQQLKHILSTTDDCLAHVAQDKKPEYLYSIRYREFLEKHLGVDEPEVFAALQNLTTDSSVGIEMTIAGDALFYLALPGRQALGIDFESEVVDRYIHHFPDGNASIARLLVRRMIPEAADGSTMDDIVKARFDYGKLDDEQSAVRLRLRSTVVNVENLGDAAATRQVKVDYVRDGQAYEVRARNCILACYNAMIPYLCPELPEKQREALAWQVKAPILYTNVALRNWRAWHELGIGALVAPSSYHTNAFIDFPVSMGGYQFAANPDEPVAIHMERFPHRANQGLSVREQRRLGRYEMLATPFATIEESVRTQLADMLAGGDFDPARDIAGITVNRWAHGYSYGYDEIDDPYYADRNDARYPHVIARQPYGRIAIANSDAAASALVDAAIEQAHRAVQELA